MAWSSALAARSSRPQRPTPSLHGAAAQFLCDEHPAAALWCGTDDGVASRVLRCSRFVSELLPQAWRSPRRSSSGRYLLYPAQFMRILYGRSRLQMCASCFVLMHQLDGTIRSGRGAARTRQEAAHLGWYGARRFFIQHPFIQRFIQAVDPSTADTPCPAPTVELYSLYST